MRLLGFQPSRRRSATYGGAVQQRTQPDSGRTRVPQAIPYSWRTGGVPSPTEAVANSASISRNMGIGAHRHRALRGQRHDVLAVRLRRLSSAPVRLGGRPTPVSPGWPALPSSATSAAPSSQLICVRSSGQASRMRSAASGYCVSTTQGEVALTADVPCVPGSPTHGRWVAASRAAGRRRLAPGRGPCPTRRIRP
jgi:hypothetical protein